MKSCTRENPFSAQPVVWAVLLGVSLACRLNFFLLMPALWAWLRINVGWKRATFLTGISAVTAAALILPIVLDDNPYSPLSTQDKFGSYDPEIPGIGRWFPILLVASALIPMFPGFRLNASKFFAWSSGLQLPWPLGLSVLGALWPDYLQSNFVLEGYLIPALVPGLLFVTAELGREDAASTPDPS